MKNFLLKVVCLAVMCVLISCVHSNPIEYTYKPNIQMGSQSGQYGAVVTDNRGEQYFINYLLFTKIAGLGDYNSITEYYYENPRNNYIRPYIIDKFKPIKNEEGVRYNAYFTRSYSKATREHSLYSPSATLIRVNMKTKHAIYGDLYKPSNAIPTIADQTNTQTNAD